jgi:beta-galactosidase
MQRVTLKHPVLWMPSVPLGKTAALYTVRTSISENGRIRDEDESRFGIRTLSLSPAQGLRINGEPVKLRGCCIHHDNGVIGARSIYKAELRKVRKLKAAGFNAIRMSHGPASEGILRACDELGVLVMDELTDMWRTGKSPDDYANHIADWWTRDVHAMVRKDRNHPSVIFYSIGNEIPDLVTAQGIAIGREIAGTIRALDPDRYTTHAVNGILTVMDQLRVLMPPEAPNEVPKEEEWKAKKADINETMAQMSNRTLAVIRSDLIANATEEAFSYVDCAGYNYMSQRYDMESVRYPNRVIVGSETSPMDIPKIWRDVMGHSNVIGDFTWTGWDYLGEAGIGKIDYTTENKYAGFSFYGQYPWLTAWCGDIDITGYRLPASYYREIVFGLRGLPYAAVWPPDLFGKPRQLSPWSFTDAVAAWDFPDDEGKPAAVEVYADADEVEMFVNGVSQGRQPIGAEHGFKTVFTAAYQPGVLAVAAYRNGAETGLFMLETPGSMTLLRVKPEQAEVPYAPDSLAFINIMLVDESGLPIISRDALLTVCVEGAGELLGFGSGAPATEESFTDDQHTTYHGRALAVIRPTGKGSITVRVSGCGLVECVAEIHVVGHSLE